MLSNSSQVDGNNDFLNPEIRRVQGFSQNLMYKLLQLNTEVSAIITKVEKLQEIVPISLLDVNQGQNYCPYTKLEL